jgi:protein TonB
VKSWVAVAFLALAVQTAPVEGQPRPFAAYEEAWRLKVEQVGAESYPPQVRTASGSVRLSVSIRSDGSVQAVTLDRSSGHPVLDDAAMWIVRQAGPFAPFPPELAKQYDTLVIVRTWFF